MLHLAAILFWTFAVIQITSLLHRVSRRQFSVRHEESLRIIEDSPYFQHLGMRPPKVPIPFKMWMYCLAVWGLGVFLISRLELAI